MVGLGVLELVAVHGAGAAVRRKPHIQGQRNPSKTVGPGMAVRR